MKKMIRILLLAAVLGGCIFTLVWSLTAKADALAKKQLTAMAKGDIDTAYSYFSNDFQKNTSQEELAQFVDDFAVLRDYAKVSFDSRSIENSVTTLSGRITSASGEEADIVYQLLKEDNEWKVLGIDIDTAGVQAGTDRLSNNADDSEADNDAALELSNRFTESSYAYTMNYPASWSYTKNGTNTVVFSGRAESEYASTTVNIQNIAGDKAAGVVADIKEQLQGADPEARISAEKNISLQAADGTNMTGKEFTIEYSYQGTDFKQRQIVIPGKQIGLLYAWAYTAPVEDYDLAADLAAEMLDSWQILAADASIAPQEILVPAETGSLTEAGYYSYIDESARGWEAYLGDGGSKASYTVQAAAAGDYTLAVHLSDDGVHSDGARSVTVKVNEQTLLYDHRSEDTASFKWYTLGTVELKKGDNTISFTKNATTSAAYVMDEFKLTPVE